MKEMKEVKETKEGRKEDKTDNIMGEEQKGRKVGRSKERKKGE